MPGLKKLHKKLMPNKKNISIPAGESLKLRYRVDLFNSNTSYFEYINKLRNIFLEKKKIVGPGSFFHIFKNEELLNNAEKLEKYLDSNRLKVVLLTPWLDYDNYDPIRKRFLKREDYLIHFRKAYEAIKNIDSNIIVLGCIQSNIISLPNELQERLKSQAELVNYNFEGFRKFNKSEIRTISDFNLRLSPEDILWDQEGRPTGEFNHYGFNKEAYEISLVVIPFSGGYQENFLKNQVNFLLMDV